MFIDRAKIHIAAGKGGNGCVSFHRAKYVPNGGPDGGDGGKGGDVVFQADEGLGTLMDFQYKKKYKAASGGDGQKNNRTGRSSDDIVIKVPVGTLIREVASGKVMADISAPDQRVVLARGGRGGRGNQHFATPSRQAPRYAEPGKPAKEYDLLLELKVIADVGLVGAPNAGKSSLLSVLTNALPKIADYPFTTLSPNLGVVRNAYGKDFVMADIPGLIEGASQGQGLGLEFLRHIERTKLLIHVTDAACLEGGDPIENLETISRELAAYPVDLLQKPWLIAANKMDLPEAALNLPRIQEYAAQRGVQIFPISAAAKAGLEDLLRAVSESLSGLPEVVFPVDYDAYEEKLDDTSPFTVEKQEEGVFIVDGPGVQKMLGYTHLDTEKGMAFFQRFMRERGIIEALEQEGAQEGDTVEVCGMAYTYYK